MSVIQSPINTKPGISNTNISRKATPNNNIMLGNTYTNSLNDGEITSGLFVNNKIMKYSENKIYTLDVHTRETNIININQQLKNYDMSHCDSIWFFENYIITYSHDFDMVMSDTDYILSIWDNTLDKRLHKIFYFEAVFAVIIHSNLLITVSNNATIRVHDIKSGTRLKTLRGHTELVDKLAAKDNLLISSSEDETVKIWDLTTGQCISTYTCDDTYVWSLCIINNIVVLGMENGTIILWDISSITTIAWTTAGHPPKNIRKIDARNPSEPRTGINSVQVYGDLLISADDKKYIKFWDMNSLELIKEYNQEYEVREIYMSDNILVCHCPCNNIILNPITILPGEYERIIGIIDEYNLARNLEREIGQYFISG